MIRRSGAIFIICGVSAFACATLAPLSAHAQSADLVLCDRIAADPSDPDKPSDVAGVAQIASSDISTAIKFCKQASGPSRRAMYQLGRAYAANRQSADAAATFRKAAERGSTSAMVELGVMLATGSGVARDEAQAQKLFQRAADGGNPRAIANLTALSSSGGAPADPTKARAMLSQSNAAEAQFQLGVMLANGAGGPKDDTGARAAFEKAAAQNHVGALEWMGAFALSGRGGPQDKTAARSYYERAATLGSEDAKAALKRMDCPITVGDKQGKVLSNLCF